MSRSISGNAVLSIFIFGVLGIVLLGMALQAIVALLRKRGRMVRTRGVIAGFLEIERGGRTLYAVVVEVASLAGPRIKISGTVYESGKTGQMGDSVAVLQDPEGVAPARLAGPEPWFYPVGLLAMGFICSAAAYIVLVAVSD